MLVRGAYQLVIEWQTCAITYLVIIRLLAVDIVDPGLEVLKHLIAFLLIGLRLGLELGSALYLFGLKQLDLICGECICVPTTAGLV